MLENQEVLTRLGPNQHYCERCGLPCSGPYPYYTKDPRWTYLHNWHSQEVRQAAALAGIKISEWCHLSKKLLAQRREEETYLTDLSNSEEINRLNDFSDFNNGNGG